MIFLNLIIFPCLYAFIVSGYCHFESCPFGKAVESVIKLSLLTALKPVYGASECNFSIWGVAVSYFQLFCNISLATLMSVALRNKFKKS